MRKLLCSLLVILALSGLAFAHEHEERFVREEASRRNITLITLEEAKRIASERIHERGVRFKDADLEDEDDYYRGKDDFRPVWSLELRTGRDEYDIDVDAVTGEILKFKIDD